MLHAVTPVTGASNGPSVMPVLLCKRLHGLLALLTRAAGSTQYEKAIMGIGKVIEHYDADKIFPMYGFGGSYQRGPANHCFPMGPNPDGTCHGVSGLLQAYRWAGVGRAETHHRSIAFRRCEAAPQPQPQPRGIHRQPCSASGDQLLCWDASGCKACCMVHLGALITGLKQTCRRPRVGPVPAWSPQAGAVRVAAVWPHPVRAYCAQGGGGGSRHGGQRAAQVHVPAHPHGRSHHGEGTSS